jgi:hypothetical protein
MAAEMTLTVQMVYHDDWLVNVLLSDGRVYTFCTELWQEWAPVPADRLYSGDYTDQDWAPVLGRASLEALQLAGAGAETWSLDGIPDTVERFKTAMNFVAFHTSDADFRRFVRHE